MSARLRCTLYPGQFSSELVALVTSASGREFSLFAPRSELEYLDAPAENAPTQGWLKVEIIDCNQSLCLVRLPQTTLENGEFITVRISQLDSVPKSQKVPVA